MQRNQPECKCSDDRKKQIDARTSKHCNEIRELAFCKLAFCKLAVCKLAFCKLAFCKLAFCKLAFCKLAVCKLAVCKLAVCSLTSTPPNEFKDIKLFHIGCDAKRIFPEIENKRDCERINARSETQSETNRLQTSPQDQQDSTRNSAQTHDDRLSMRACSTLIQLKECSNLKGISTAKETALAMDSQHRDKRYRIDSTDVHHRYCLQDRLRNRFGKCLTRQSQERAAANLPQRGIRRVGKAFA